MGLRGCLPAWICSLACAFSCSRRNVSICISDRESDSPVVQQRMLKGFCMSLFARRNVARSQDEGMVCTRPTYLFSVLRP